MRNHLKLCIVLFISFNAIANTIHAEGTPVTLAKDKKSSWQITTVSDKKEVQFAAQELQKYLAKISDANLPLGAKAKSSYNIIIGLKQNIPAAYKKLLPVTAKGFNGYSIAVSQKPAVVVIAGDDIPGVIYGTYALLEKLGCRWYYPQQDVNDPEVIPHLNTVSLNTGAWSVASPTQYRIYNGDGWFFKMDFELAKIQLDWAMKNRYNMVGWQALASNSNISLEDQYADFKKNGVEAELMKRGMYIHGPAHSFDQLLNSGVYFKDHPEWFGMRDGKRVPQTYVGAQFCWSNADARKELIKNAEAFIV
ncbi:MAG: hypothetical protein EOP51_22250, partial [Sphingobacteriales bacterium]